MLGLLNKFSYKVLGLALAVVLTAQAATVITVLDFAADENDRIARQDLDKASRGFQRALQHRSKALGDIIYAVTANPDFVRAVRSQRDRERVLTTIQTAMAQANVKAALLYTAAGTVDTTFGIDPQDQDAFAELLDQQSGIVLLDNAAYEMAVRPINKDKPVGYLAMGYAIDDNIASRMGGNTGIDISILRTQQSGKVALLGSSLPTEEREMIQATADKVATGADSNIAKLDLSDHFSSKALPYAAADPRVLVVFHKRVSDARRPFVALRGAMTHATGVSIVGALLLAMLLSRAVTTPVRQLLMAARRMSVGNYSKKLNINSSDEFGELAKAFETMRKGISEREQRIVYQAEFDSLTGLPNRLHAMDLLRESLRNAAKNGDPVVVMVMHLQRFREIQSSLGHEIFPGPRNWR